MKTSNNKGLGLAEFIMIIIFILLIVSIIIFTLGGEIKDSITKASCYISNKDYVEGEESGQSYCSKRK